MIKYKRKRGNAYVEDKIYTKKEVDKLIEDAVQRTIVVSWENIPNKPPALESIKTPSAPTICKEVDSLLISWNTIENADTYDLLREEVPSGDLFIVADGISETSYNDTDPHASQNQEYKYRVRGRNSAGFSDYSPYSATESYDTATAC